MKRNLLLSFLFLIVTMCVNAQTRMSADGEIVFAEKDWTGCTEEDLLWYEIADGQEGSVTASEDGIVITLPTLSSEIWQPQTMILDGAPLTKGLDYTVRITAKIPSDGQLQVQMGSWEEGVADQYSVDVTGSDEFQTIDVKFPSVPYEDAHVLFQSGFIVGTTVVKKVQILCKADVWTLAGDESLLGTDWDVSSISNNMITNDGNIYTLTKNNLTLSMGTYHFKVYKNNATDESYPSSDASLVINENGNYTIQFTFNSHTKELSAKAYLYLEDDFETAAEAVKNMKIGWNLVNTLDAYGDSEPIEPWEWSKWEMAWGQRITKPELMKMIRKAGFNTMRIPVTWYLHTDSNGKVDPQWMKRVHEVVDYVIDQGMYCILNTHHETASDIDDNGKLTGKAKLIADKDNYKENKEWFENLWRQIAEEFKDYDQRLLFEGYNEMTDKTGAFCYPNGELGEEHIQQAYQAINDYAQSFVNAVRSTGGNNLMRNLVVNTYSACVGPGEDKGSRRPYRELRIPDDVVQNHIIFGIHCYWMVNEDDAQRIINNVNKCFTSRGVPTIISEYGTDMNNLDIALTKRARENNIAPIIWSHIVSEGNLREFPAFCEPEKVKTILKAYYGNDYEPELLTEDDYDCWGINVSYGFQDAAMILYGKINLNEYKGIRVEVEKTDGLEFLVVNDTWEKCQSCDASESLFFDRSIFGDEVSGVLLRNVKEGANEAKIIKAYLIRNDGTEEMIGVNNLVRFDGCEYELLISRKQFVHTVDFDDLWSELNIFYDDVPLKLKNYKGIRLELAETPTEEAFSVKVYGDGQQKEDCLALTGASTTIMFNTDIFSKEINRVTLQSNIDGKNEAKVIGAWLIRQDDTEEYSDLIPYWGCEITDMTPYILSSITDDNITTDINELKSVEMKNEEWFSISGQRISKPTKKGFYIRNGRKVIIK